MVTYRHNPSRQAKQRTFPSNGQDDRISQSAAQARRTLRDAPVIRAVDQLLEDAIQLNASDIHIEPGNTECRIRFRVDGLLRDVPLPPISNPARLVARLKVMSQLNIAERRLPQDGRLNLSNNHRSNHDFRVSTLPTLWGEKVVLRALPPLQASMNFVDLGFTHDQQTLLQEAINRPQGMVLVTGPTGSGKTVTLYSILAELNDVTKNISSAEDPIELGLEGINQLQVKPAIGLDFAAALRSFLRQDPDVIMVGEIRDQETAQIAAKAAQTGHLVLSTLHTNSAAQTVARLLDMGLESYNLAGSLTLVISQRLIRKLCSHCKAPQHKKTSTGSTPEAELSTRYRPVGCEQCHDGYKGRIGIYEVVPINEAMSRIIIAGGNSMDIEKSAREAGYRSLRQSAMMRLTEGLTSLDEVYRVS